ncbi:hypothetical protein MCOR02_010264 [Pyricularia oryzae]|nr:hypothetical protein MCOR01_002549 [Pyricularia oryzae]KAH9428842.1 hypothetical protein MCOR02_010264 [Pyricularia oryzae]KAI6286527.1 hypothetical protein MCOR26_000919 [Pyricularia oryzae]KAI6310495.1 hypothetical protein MCOR30_011113 [Pyricularia oryzae]KAI6317761.1 hypothetical protein MCOR29_006215 [Pyricularia oryzae]
MWPKDPNVEVRIRPSKESIAAMPRATTCHGLPARLAQSRRRTTGMSRQN